MMQLTLIATLTLHVGAVAALRQPARVTSAPISSSPASASAERPFSWPARTGFEPNFPAAVRSKHAAAAATALLTATRASAADTVLRGAAVVEEYAKTDPALLTFEPRGITPEDTVIFVIGCVPFVWAAIEFWTRIANGDSFGTGKDSVVIQPLGQQYEGNKRVLGQDAMTAAYILFALAGASALLVIVGVVDVLGQ